jgi:hypothetical protein
VNEDEPAARTGVAFWLCAACGLAIVGFGFAGLLTQLEGPALASWLKVFGGGLLVHDAIFAPLVVLGSVGLVRIVPVSVRAPVQGALIVSCALVAIAIPVVGGYGRLANNPSLLPSDRYGTRLVAALAIVWLVAAVVAVVLRRSPAGSDARRSIPRLDSAILRSSPSALRLATMGRITVRQQGTVGAPADLTYRLIADDEHHQRFLPDAFSDFEVLEGGVGAGTLHRFKVTAGGRTREYVMRVDEPEPGRVITEADQGSSLVTSFTVTPSGDGAASSVTIDTQWDGAKGIGGFFERTFAPRVMRRMYADELSRLDRYAREQAARA